MLDGEEYGRVSSYMCLRAQAVKNPSAMDSLQMGTQEIWVWSLGWEDLLEEGTATHSSILAWRSPWKKEPGGLRSTGSWSAGHDVSDSTPSTTTYDAVWMFLPSHHAERGLVKVKASFYCFVLPSYTSGVENDILWKGLIWVINNGGWWTSSDFHEWGREYSARALEGIGESFLRKQLWSLLWNYEESIKRKSSRRTFSTWEKCTGIKWVKTWNV